MQYLQIQTNIITTLCSGTIRTKRENKNKCEYRKQKWDLNW